MEQRRFLLFVTLSLAVLMGWSYFVVPVLFPKPAKPPAGQAAADDDQNPDENEAAPANPDKDQAGDADVVAANPEAENPELDKPAAGEPEQDAPDKPADDDPDQVKQAQELPEHKHREIRLGSAEYDSGYRLDVTLTTMGAAIEGVSLNDLTKHRYVKLDSPPPPNQVPLQILGTAKDFKKQNLLRTFQSAVVQIDQRLKKIDKSKSLNTVDWEVLELVKSPGQEGVATSVTFRYVSPDGELEVRKHFQIHSAAEDPAHPDEAAAYRLGVDISVVNHSDANQTVSYELQGPVGLPLENEENTRKYRDVKFGRVDDGDVDATTIDADTIIDAHNEALEENKEHAGEPITSPFTYIGIDVQYFAALILPDLKDGDGVAIPVGEWASGTWLREAVAGLVTERKDQRNWSDISVRLYSKEFTLEPGEKLTHSYTLYAGPKRDELLEPIGAAEIIDYGWFGWISRGMIKLLTFLHDVVRAPYWLAIIVMTIIVRACLFPLSRKQAAGAKKMKELQPQIAELKKKYSDDKEKFARAQMELMSKNNYNPLAGCLPVLFQMPIFFGLYSALNNAVDLRMAPFLWIENLAAPDALFPLPFTVPLAGWTEFNLLPFITVALFVGQQKMFMPPPTDKEQELQHKMMKFMTLFMGVLFYKVPSGLCLYFIASSLWGMGERKLLDYGVVSDPTKPDPDAKLKPTDPDVPRKKSLFLRMMEMADEAASQSKTASGEKTTGNGQAEDPPGGKRGNKRDGGGSRRKKRSKR